jgi:hypothetical protein
MRCAGVCVVACVVLGTAGCRETSTIEVLVQVPGDVPVTCADVVAWSGSASPERAGPFAVDAGSSYSVGVYSGGTLGHDVSFQAHGFTGAACDQLLAESVSASASFGGGGPVILVLGTLCDGGACAGTDAGVTDSGTTDSGTGDAGGRDAGQNDAGPTDAGQPDAGPPADAGAGDAGCTAGQSCPDNGICTASGSCVTYFSGSCPPSNFGASDLPPIASPLSFSCGRSILDTGTTGTSVTTSNWCGPVPVFAPVSQSGGPEALVLATTGLYVDAGSSLIVRGARPLILAVLGDAQVDGILDVSALFADGGPGASVSCTVGLGGAGTSGAAGGGGGGGGFGGAGAAGGAPGGTGGGGGSNGQAEGNASLIPLRAGCAGGAGANSGGKGGEGGGALQISATGTVTINGEVLAEGGGGLGVGGGGGGGAGGGGSGGAILLEANQLGLGAASSVTANGGGGGGGAGGTALAPGHDGFNGLPDSGSNAPGGVWDGYDSGDGGVGGALAGSPDVGGTGGTFAGIHGGGGGGGGGVGIIRFNACMACQMDGGALVSPASGGSNCP